MAERAPRHHVMVDFPQHQQRLYVVLEEDHEKVEKRAAAAEDLLQRTLDYCTESGLPEALVAEFKAILSSQQQVDPQPFDFRQDLQCWFGLSYAAWCVMPRVLMEAMPVPWQSQMARLLHQFTATWETSDLPAPYMTPRLEGRFTKWPDWLLNYRHPAKSEIESRRRA